MCTVAKVSILLHTLAVLAATTSEQPEKHNDWPVSKHTRGPGHYPHIFCTLTHVILNVTDAAFIYKSDGQMSCSDVWSMRNRQWRHPVTCDETYDVGMAFTIYYYYGSNYFHLHTDMLIPLFSLFYHDKDNSHLKVAFMPVVESRRLEIMNWDTPAFKDPSKYWMQILQVIAGRHTLLPLDRALLDTGTNICFNRLYLGTPDVKFDSSNFIQAFVRFVKTHFGVKDSNSEITDRLALDHRLGRRKILNLEELANAVRPFIAVDLINFSGKTFREQVELMQKYTIFAAINGAGLMNALYLPVYAVSIQLVPFKSRLNFKEYGTLLKSRGPYMEWHNQHEENHFRQEGDDYDNQPNTVVHVAEFVDLIKAAMNLAQKTRHSKKDEL